MANTIVLGMQWGDEGKGKIVDLICPAFDAVARYQGGHNAGHTVKFADRHFSLHLIPSGVLHPSMKALLGNGMVIAPDAFLSELERLRELGVEADTRLFVADRAQVLLPTHAALDQGRELARGDRKIGTTSRGIGPAYESKASRSGLRALDLVSEGLEDKVAAHLARVAPELEHLGTGPAPSVAELSEQCRAWGEALRPYLRPGASLVNGWIDDGQGVLFEGAQGALLDIDHGTYPYVTSSNAVAGGVCSGAGVAPTRIDGVIGVIKAYTTRVGAGPFPTELHGEVGEHLRARGHEFGTTTGRPRRCGWFDAVAARYARMLSGIDVLALTKIDVLDEVDEIQVCTAYRYRGEELTDFPGDLGVLAEVEPVYQTVSGWRQNTVGSLELGDLPSAARDYIALLEKQVGAPAALISSGPRREETILRDHPDLNRLLGGHLEQVLSHRGVP